MLFLFQVKASPKVSQFISAESREKAIELKIMYELYDAHSYNTSFNRALINQFNVTTPEDLLKLWLDEYQVQIEENFTITEMPDYLDTERFGNKNDEILERLSAYFQCEPN